MRISEIGTFTTAPFTCSPQKLQPAPYGITLNARRAVNIEMMGARM